MMSAAELAAEIIAASDEALREWLCTSLDRYGVSRGLANIRGMVWPVRGHLDGGHFQLSADGRRLWCVPVRIAGDPDAPDPQDVVRWSPMVDAVAFDPAEPTRWATRLGLADWLGCADTQDVLPEPVVVHRDALSWLRARCTGIVLLTGNPRAAQSVLFRLRRVLAEDVEHGRELRRICEAPFPGPEILVPEPVALEPA
jgi:hypothetical protein